MRRNSARIFSVPLCFGMTAIMCRSAFIFSAGVVDSLNRLSASRYCGVKFAGKFTPPKFRIILRNPAVGGTSRPTVMTLARQVRLRAARLPRSARLPTACRRR